MISVTTITSYLYCQRKLFLSCVLGIREPPKAPMVLGTVRHDTYEGITNKEGPIVCSITEKRSLKDIKELYRKEFSEILRDSIRKNKELLEKLNLDLGAIFKKIWPLILKESESRALNIHSFMEMHLVYGRELWEKLTPKIKSEYRIEAPSLQLKGVIDQIEIYEAGFVPVELKTGKAPKEDVWENHKIQLGAYALLLEEHFKIPVKEGFVNYLDSQERRHVPINPFLKDDVKELIKKTQSILDSEEIPDFTDNPNKCAGCGVRDTCYDKKLLNELLNNGKKNNKTKDLNIT
ncbi:CRISPR-associated protein Cas4 [Candidatus Woesearchaeota archaeon]|nr:CRISPR-associated protein Cas4 [Candidatus Woesearchaeota archaeon]